MKSEKWALRALKGVLVGYDGHTIHRVYIKDQKKIIRVKGLRIFEDYETKTSIELPHYDDNKPTFQGFLSEDIDEEGSEELSSTCVEGRKVGNTEGKQSTSDIHAGRKVNDAEPVSTSNARAGQKA